MLIKHAFLFLSSLLIVAFGQPAWQGGVLFSILASACGYSLFFYLLLDFPQAKKRFFLGTVWFAAIQAIQLGWFLSHPYLYIYAIYVIFAVLMGMQFGTIALFICKATLCRYSSLLGLAGLWTVMEWIRLFLFSGYTFNPIGMALTSNPFSIQLAAFIGVYGLSFWVLLTNLFGVAVIANATHKVRHLFIWSVIALFPYLLGGYQYETHRLAFEREKAQLNVLAVQTAFPVDEPDIVINQRNTISYVMKQWRTFLQVLKPYQGMPTDLILLPEYVVLCGTYSCVFSEEYVKQVFTEIFGPEVLRKNMPKSSIYLSKNISTEKGSFVLVNNAYWVQTLANIMNSAVMIGLEDADDIPKHGREYYSTAQFFLPNKDTGPVGRYEKRVLLPFGEYIPFECCRELAACYGIKGSFIPGTKAKIFKAAGQPFGASICYEETFGDLMRENKQLGAKALVNLTSDAWYPHSRLALQHLHHARLRTVENGIALIRSSNLGITGAWDSLGRRIGWCGDPEHCFEFKEEAIHLKVPLYTYPTLYSVWGDGIIVSMSGLFILYALFLALAPALTLALPRD